MAKDDEGPGKAPGKAHKPLPGDAQEAMSPATESGEARRDVQRAQQPGAGRQSK